MNKQAFERGFLKAAMSNGVDILTATQLLKHANLISAFQDQVGLADPAQLDRLGSVAAAKTLGGAALGGAGGAAVGGLTGYLTGRDKQHPENDHSIRNGALLGLLGGGLGGVGGGTLGAMSGGKELNSYIQAHPHMLVSLGQQ